MTLEELNTFIGLLYLRGVMNARNFLLKLLWSKKYDTDAFRKAVPRNRFMDIMRHIRFDNKSTRSERVQTDKFCLISHVLNRFVENSQKSFVPKSSLTVDKQLFPTKSRCRFTQYMPNKTDKLGIKF